MRSRTLAISLVVSMTGLAACGGGTEVPDSGNTDGGGTDGGGNPVDGGGMQTDGGGTPTDGGGSDAGPDGGPVDGGPQVDCMALVPPALDVEVRAMGLNRPVAMAQPPGETSDLYVVEQAGRIVIVNAAGNQETFLDLDGTTTGTQITGFPNPTGGDERGLLGLAFHPNYAANGRFFVMYTSNGRDIVREYRRTAANPRRAEDPAPPNGIRILDIDSVAGNHNGGQLAFGPDGFLYAGTGDGGDGCDEHGSGNFNAQNLDSPLGKVHRFNVDGTAPYAAPGNPFTAAGRTTIWSYGWRNPWRFSFDRMTGDLWVGDVGQNRREEIDFQPSTSTGGENYGWHFREGTISSAMSGCAGGPEPAGHVPPVFDYPRGGGGTITGNTVIGGFVYRGSAISGLQGWYLFGDAGSGGRAAIRQCPGGAVNVRTLTDLVGLAPALTSFGEDNSGELYMLALFDGEVLRIIAR